MPMDFEGSISSWFGKIREGFDTFCLEAKDILPLKPVEDIVQEQLITAAENLKKICFDLNVFSNFKLDSEQGNSSPTFAEMEENTDLGLVKPENSSPVSLSKSSSRSEFPTSSVGSYEEEGSDFEFHVTVLKEDNSTKRSEFEEEEDPYEWYIPPPSLEGSEGSLHDPAPLMASDKCSHDDKQKSSSISGCKFCTSTQDYAHGSSGETGSDSQFENQNPDYCHLLGHDLRDELIKHGFLSPLSGSVQSILSKQSEETEEIDISSDDKVTSSVSSISSRTSNPILDMSISWSNCKQSWVCDHVVVAAQTNQENAENVQDKEWERLDEDFSDEDWEIV